MNNINAKISKLTHRGKIHIKVDIPNTPLARERIKAVSGRKFSRTHRCWYIPNTFEAIDELKQHFEVESSQTFKNKENNSLEKWPSTSKTLKPIIKAEKKFRIQQQGDQSFKVFIGNKIILEQHKSEWIRAYVPYDKKGWVEIVRKYSRKKMGCGRKILVSTECERYL